MRSENEQPRSRDPLLQTMHIYDGRVVRLFFSRYIHFFTTDTPIFDVLKRVVRATTVLSHEQSTRGQASRVGEGGVFFVGSDGKALRCCATDRAPSAK